MASASSNSRLSVIAKLAAGVVLVFALVEIFLRVYFSVWGTPIDRVMYITPTSEIAQSGTRFIGLPFIGFGPSASHPEHNRYGFRGAEITVPKPEDVFRVATLGGSTTYGAGLGPEQTWPAQLQHILHETYGYTQVEVVNVASVGHTTWSTLTNFAFRVIDIEPDLIMIYHATNDSKARLTHPDCYLGQTPVTGLYDGIWRVDGPAVSPLTTLRYIGITTGHAPNPIDLNHWIVPVEASDPTCRALPALDEAAALAANPPMFFERNLRNLIHLAAGNDVGVMLSTWAYYPPYLDAHWAQAFSEANEVTRRVAGDMDVAFYDLMATMPEDESLWNFDGEHQTPAGAAEQARQYAAYLVDTGIVPAP